MPCFRDEKTLQRDTSAGDALGSPREQPPRQVCEVTSLQSCFLGCEVCSPKPVSGDLMKFSKVHFWFEAMGVGKKVK